MSSHERSAALVAIVVTLMACGSPDRSDQPPNIVLVTFDTLRADHLGCYGYDRDTSPHIDTFSQTATRYTRAMASSPWTIPTHASLFTGRDPFEHGARSVEIEVPVDNVSPLDEGAVTLAEALAEEGYRTAAFVANAGFLGRRWQMDQGFGLYHAERMFSSKLNRRVFEWLDTADERPFFLFVNYIDTHRPYNAAHRPGFSRALPTADSEELVERLRDMVMGEDAEVPPELVAQVIEQYDTAIANVDEQFGALVDRLERLGLADNTLVVATSDHGEYFGEHLLVEHSKDLYQPVISIPLLIRSPGQRTGEVVNRVTSSVDVPGLIFAEFPDEIAARQARRFTNLPGNHPVISEIYYTRPNDLFHPVWGHRFDRIRRALYEWPHKYIHSSDGDHELFDLVEDPAESRNLIREQPERSARLARRLQALLASRSHASAAPAPEELSTEEIEELRALGYSGE
jgi:arylsulfatase A-like enzyme